MLFPSSITVGIYPYTIMAQKKNGIISQLIHNIMHGFLTVQILSIITDLIWMHLSLVVIKRALL